MENQKNPIVPYSEEIYPKSRKLGRIKGHLDRNQRIAFNVLLKIAYDQLVIENPAILQNPEEIEKTRIGFKFPFRKFLKMCGFDYQEYYKYLFKGYETKTGEKKNLIQTLLDLQRTIYIIEWKDEENKTYRVKSGSLLSFFEINTKEDYIYFVFPPHILDKILVFKNFYFIYFPIICSMRSSYSIGLYEQILQRKGFGKWQVKIEELKELLGVEKEEYKNTWDFQKRVLKPAIEEINRIHNIDLQAIKIINSDDKRKILGFEFIWNVEKFDQAIEKYLPAQTQKEIQNLGEEKMSEIEKKKEELLKQAEVLKSQEKLSSETKISNEKPKTEKEILEGYIEKILSNPYSSWSDKIRSLQSQWWYKISKKELEKMTEEEKKKIEEEVKNRFGWRLERITNPEFRQARVRFEMLNIIIEKLIQQGITPPENIEELKKEILEETK